MRTPKAFECKGAKKGRRARKENRELHCKFDAGHVVCRFWAGDQGNMGRKSKILLRSL